MTVKHLLLVSLVMHLPLILWVTPAMASEASEGTTPAASENTSLGHFPGAVVDDIVALPTWENAWWLLGGTALTITVYQFEDAEAAAEALDQGVWDGLSDFGNIWGDMRVQVPLALGSWGIGTWTKNHEMAALGFDLSRGLLLSYSVVSIMKPLVDRTRPNGEKYSFPSGHTATAFTTAGVVTRRCGGWAGGLTIGLGILTAMGRMEDMKHYASDVVAGATIGWIIGRTVARDKNEDGMAWQILPTGRGIMVAKEF